MKSSPTNNSNANTNISPMKSIKKVSGRYCAVKYCRSDPKNTQFFGFPSKKIEQKLLWIKALKGISSTADVICCNHFHKLKPSNNPSDPDYVPTIFKCYHIQLQLKRKNAKKREKLYKVMTTTTAPTTSTTNGSLEDHSSIIDIEEGIDIPPSVPNSTILISDPITIKNEEDPLPIECDMPVSPSDTILTTSSPVIDQQRNPKEDFFTRVLSSDHDCMSLCGVPSSVLFKVCGSINQPHSKDLSKLEKVMIFFMKLRFNNPFTFIGALFGTNELTARESFISVTKSIFMTFKNSVQWVPDNFPLKYPNQSIFNSEFPKAKAMLQIIEMNIETPEGDDSETVPTMKYLIATSPSGIALFISRPYGGQFSDTHIVLDSGLFELLEKNDLVFCRKGFENLEQYILNKGAFLRRISDHETTLASQIKRISKGIRQFEVLKMLDNNLLPYMEVLIFCVAAIRNLILQFTSHTI
ncbi:uncharacterized protein [Lepeophtheirus salmonis]|nr:uncharacterized protein LOC121113605 isoform X2 [Lepeophtheirus salmonis]